MFEYFEAQKNLIAEHLKRELGRPSDELDRVNRFGPETRARLLEFALRGKMIRGGLVRLGAELFADAPLEVVTACGAALELFQSSLLIHDDIMDRDHIRRGRPTMHVRYAADASGLADPAHVGGALATCAGDIGFFLGFRIIADSGASPDMVVRLIRLVAGEMMLVGTAQMLDVWNGELSPERRDFSDEEIISLYRYKTGRYTFALPLSAGALLAGADAVRPALEALGEKLGIIFQIKDDELGLFGEEKDTGKPAGSDLRAGKHTIFFSRLAKTLSGEERARFYALWGNPSVGREELEHVRRLVRSSGAAESAARTVEAIAVECRREIEALPAPRAEMKRLLFTLLDESLARTA